MSENPYKSIPWTARHILQREYKASIALHVGIAKECADEGRFDGYQASISSLKFYETELAKVNDSLS